MGKGVCPRAMCTTLLLMDINAILNPILEFFSAGVGAMIADFVKVVYALLYPANAEAASLTPGA